MFKKPENPLVYIILVNWNGGEDTLACLASLAKIFWKNHKIILIDNASQDGSTEAAAKAFPQIEIIRNSENMRFAHANNQGVERALSKSADFVLLLNNDTEVAPDFLNHLIEAAVADRTIGIVGPGIYYFQQPEILWFAGGEISLWKGKIAHRGIREKDVGQFEEQAATGYITGCCMLVSRACLEKTGLLDESYFIYTEDADFCFRAWRAGFKIVFQPASKIWHKISSSSGGREVAGGMTPFKVYHKIRGAYQFFGKYAKFYHWPTIILFSGFYFFKAAIMMLATKNWQGLRAMVKTASGPREM